MTSRTFIESSEEEPQRQRERGPDEFWLMCQSHFLLLSTEVSVSFVLQINRFPVMYRKIRQDGKINY